jgi:cytosine/adenosine deaminase-related metal-dependent hydrolase
MCRDGIVAVGDIGNTSNSIDVKAKGKMLWNNFVEVLGFRDENLEQISQKNLDVLKQFHKKEQELPENLFKSSLVPHAPYTVGSKIFEWINKETTKQTISCHNQETISEDHLYQTGQGDFLKLLKKFGIEKSPFPITGKTSLQSWLPHFNHQQKLILVHNTFINAADIDFALDHAREHLSGLFFCLCVNANLYIENQLPPVEMLVQKGVDLVIGTDSYSSNDQLSISAEIRTIRKNLPSIPLDMVLRWATYNGAKALGRENEIGSFEKGNHPGILLLNEDLEANRIL